MVVEDVAQAQELTFRRQHGNSVGTFKFSLHLVVNGPAHEKLRCLQATLRDEGFSGEEALVEFENGTATVDVDFGPVGESTLAEAAQVTRILLANIGLDPDAPLRVRYGGSMDPNVAGPALERVRRRGGPIARAVAKVGSSSLGRK
jgi:hypothetical protein